MNTTSIEQIDQEIRNIQNQLQALGAMHPGNMSKQYQICGRPGCRCVDPKNPQRHGPYFKLTYVYRGRQACRFVRAGTEGALAGRLAVYKSFRALVDRWVALSIQRGIIDFFPSAPKPKKKPKSTREKRVARTLKARS
jgi:hypothetical protein